MGKQRVRLKDIIDLFLDRKEIHIIPCDTGRLFTKESLEKEYLDWCVNFIDLEDNGIFESTIEIYIREKQ